MPILDLDPLIDDVKAGLTEQVHRLNDAAMAQAFFDYEGKRFMQVFLRDAETPFDYVQRPYRASGLLRQVTGVLTQHLYSPGPTREWDVPAGQRLLERAYRDNHVDALMLRCDQLSTINDVAAIQVDADAGDFAGRPIRLRAWGAQDFHAWTDPDDRTRAAAVVTIDRYDRKNVYRLWNEEEVVTLEDRKSEIIGGDVTAEVTAREPNTYGCLPFATVHYEQPITTFWERGIGGMLTQAEIRANDRLSRLDESINKHLNPIPIATDVQATWQPVLEPQRFIRLSTRGSLGPDGAYSKDGPPPKLEYLQATIDVAGSWEDLLKFLNQVLEACGVPLSAVRMEPIGVASGIALVVEQAPLLTRARARRKPFAIYETELARTILRCAGNHYRRPELVRAAADGTLALGWPMFTVPVPTQDNLDLMVGQVNAGILSVVMLVEQWYGVDREGAFRMLERVERDNLELARRAPRLHLALAGSGRPAPGGADAGTGEGPPPAGDDDGDPGGPDPSESDGDNQAGDFHQMIVNL